MTSTLFMATVAAALFFACSLPCSAQPAGSYSGTLTTTEYDINVAKPIKVKEPISFFIGNAGQVIILTPRFTISGSGVFGTSHGYGNIAGSNYTGTTNIHFGKDFLSDKGTLILGKDLVPSAARSIDGKFTLKNVTPD